MKRLNWGKQKAEQRRRPERIRPAGESKKTVYSYYSTQPQVRRNDTEKVVELGSFRHRLRLIPTVIAAAVIAGSFLFSLTLSAKPSVSIVDGQASVYRDISDYAAETERILGEKLSYKTKLSINTHEVQDELLKRFPELNAAVLRLPVLGRRPNLVVDIRQPELLLKTQAKSYVIDSTGMVVSEIQDLAAEYRQGLHDIRDDSGLDLVVGKQAVTSDTVSFINDAVALLEAQKLKVGDLTLPRSANQLDIYIEGLSYYVKTDVAGDVRLQIGSYLAVKDHLAGQGTVPAEYVDVRVEEKVFYK